MIASEVREMLSFIDGNPTAYHTTAAVRDILLKAGFAELLESRKFQAEEICRWFGLPPHKVALLDRATFSNIESQAREALTDCIMPWVLRLERAQNASSVSMRLKRRKKRNSSFCI